MQIIGMFSFVKRTLLFVCLLYLFFFINTQTAFSQSTSLMDFTTEAFKAMIQEATTSGPVALCNSLPVPSLLCNFVLKPVVDVLNRKYPNWHSDKEIALNAIDNDTDINNLISLRLSQLSLEHDEILKDLRELGNNQYEIQTSLKSVLDNQYTIIRKQEEILKILKEQGITSGPRWNDAIIRDPMYAYAYYNRGVDKSELEDYRGSIQDYNKAIELDPNFPIAYYNRGNSKGAIKDYRGAIQDYSKAIETDPNYAAAYHNRGSIKGRIKDYRGAIQDYSKAIELNPNLAYAYFNRGYTKDAIKDYSGSIQDYNKAIELNPNVPRIYFNRGLVKYKLGQKDSACRDWSKAGELGESDANSYWHKHCD